MGYSTKRCPFCGENILAEAIKCKHCKEFLDGRATGLNMQSSSQGVTNGGLWCPKCKRNVEPQIVSPGCFTSAMTTELRCPYCGKMLKQKCCFIATCVFASPKAPEVLTLSQFRDRILLKYKAGQWFVALYYCIGPFCVKFLEICPVFKAPIRNLLCAITIMLSKKND